MYYIIILFKKYVNLPFTWVRFCAIITMYIFSEFGNGGWNMKIVKLFVGDVLEMKKNHPCGSNQFKVLRVGSDVRVLCLSCGRDMTLDRIKLEKSIKRFIVSHNPENI